MQTLANNPGKNKGIVLICNKNITIYHKALFFSSWVVYLWSFDNGHSEMAYYSMVHDVTVCIRLVVIYSNDHHVILSSVYLDIQVCLGVNMKSCISST